MDLNDDDVMAILKMLETSAFGDLELETSEFRLRLRRADGGGWTRESATLRPAHLLQPATPPRAEFGNAATEASDAPMTATDSDLVDVHTPLPGTFYRSPKPGSPPFVQLGMQVDANTVVAIVETMKLMNSVYAGVAGEVAEICLTDASFAPQGRVVMRIKAQRS